MIFSAENQIELFLTVNILRGSIFTAPMISKTLGGILKIYGGVSEISTVADKAMMLAASVNKAIYT